MNAIVIEVIPKNIRINDSLVAMMGFTLFINPNHSNAYSGDTQKPTRELIEGLITIVEEKFEKNKSTTSVKNRNNMSSLKKVVLLLLSPPPPTMLASV